MDRISFADITAPVAPRDFFSKYWTREAVLLRAAGRDFDRYFGWDALNSVLNIPDLGTSIVKVARGDRPAPLDEYTTTVDGRTIVNPRSVLALFDDGASFGITGADLYWAPLRAVADGIYDALLESPNLNVYCSPPNIQGFHCHFDQHEVFVLQIEGAKHWRVFKPTTEWPVTSWRMEDAAAVLETTPYLDVTLQKGDVLYVPRGHWHYAVAQDSISVHVTAGVSCRKSLDFCSWLSDQLACEAVWRENAPLLNDAMNSRDVASWGDALKRSLIAKVSEPGIFERYRQHVTGSLQPRATIALPFQSATVTAPVDTLVFERPPGRAHVITEADDAVTVSSAGCEFQLEASFRPLLTSIFEADSFTASDLLKAHPGIASDDLADLLRELMKLGLLTAR